MCGIDAANAINLVAACADIDWATGDFVLENSRFLLLRVLQFYFPDYCAVPTVGQ